MRGSLRESNEKGRGGEVGREVTERMFSSIQKKDLRLE
jgi:hypothetical protein